MLIMKGYVTPLLVLLHVIGGFAFAPIRTAKAPVSLASRSLLRSTSSDTAFEDNKAVDSLTSRRSLLNKSLSLVATTAYLQSCNANAEEESSTTGQPYTVLFTVQLDSSKPEELSELEIECRPDWAPGAAARFRELVELGFYKDSPFFRVLPGFIAQFGISADQTLNKQWMYCDTTDKEAVKLCQQPLVDEPRNVPNKKGTLSFASSGKNSRRTQVFINLTDNSGIPNFLDGQGFVPFARIVRGEEIVKELNNQYKGNVSQGKAAYYGKEYFEQVFPKLSVIRDAKIL